MLNPPAREKLFQIALGKRLESEPRLHNPLEIGRYFAGEPDGLEGVLVDAFGPLVVLTIYNQRFVAEAEALLGALRTCVHGERFFIAKIRSEAGEFRYLDSDHILGHRWTATEDDCAFEVRADDKNDFGLFSDARPARLALRQIVGPESQMLNLFSYTCGFAVVACRRGIRSAVNVDANSEMLSWGKRNAELNGVDFAVIPELAQKYLARLERRVAAGKVECPDVWVCDPPAFGAGRGHLRLLKYFWDDFWIAVEKLTPRAVLVLRNDRTGYRRENSLLADVRKRVGHAYDCAPVSFAQSPSLCYEGNDCFYKLNESLVLLKR
jgi:23S rRNA (cytosine1962-C5)-methyltransferase